MTDEFEFAPGLIDTLNDLTDKYGYTGILHALAHTKDAPDLGRKYAAAMQTPMVLSDGDEALLSKHMEEIHTFDKPDAGQCRLGFHAWVPWLTVFFPDDPTRIHHYATWCARPECDHLEQFDV